MFEQVQINLVVRKKRVVVLIEWLKMIYFNQTVN